MSKPVGSAGDRWRWRDGADRAVVNDRVIDGHYMCLGNQTTRKTDGTPQSDAISYVDFKLAPYWVPTFVSG